MKKQETPVKSRTRHSEQYKDEALSLAERVGIPSAANQLGLNVNMLYSWRSKKHLQREQGETEQLLATENARLKRQLADQVEELAILKKAAAYFARNQK
jgi:transposase